MSKRLTVLLLVGLAVFSIGVPVGTGRVSAAPISVLVSVLPQKYFVERVGGEHVRVSVVVGPGQNPETYDPTPKQMRELSDADVYFRIGVPFEQLWMDKWASLNPDMTVVDTRKGVPLRDIEAHVHEGGGRTVHDHQSDEKDPHIWLDPGLVKIQAQTIYETLAQIDPEHRSDYAENLAGFLADLDEVDREIREKLSDLETRTMMVFHPAWGYFTDAYGLKQVPIELGGKEPSAKEMAQLLELAAEEKVKAIFVQSQFSTKAAAAIAKAVGADVVQLDPLSSDYLNNLRHIAGTVKVYLSK